MPVNIYPYDLEKLTEKQCEDLAHQAERLNKVWPDVSGFWDIAFREESRPGRGHSIRAWWADSDKVASVDMDVYGYGRLVFVTMDVEHSDYDEEHHDDYGGCEHFPEEAEPDEEPNTSTGQFAAGSYADAI